MLERSKCFDANFRLLKTIYVHLLMLLKLKMHSATVKMVNIFVVYDVKCTWWKGTRVLCAPAAFILKVKVVRTEGGNCLD
jgi:hypothetical protein